MMSSSQAPFTYLAPPRPPPPRKHLGPSPPSCCKAGEGSPPRRAPPPLRLPRRCWTLPRFNEKKKQRKKLPKRRKETRSISDYLCKWPVMINQKLIISYKIGKVLVIFKCVENSSVTARVGPLL